LEILFDTFGIGFFAAIPTRMGYSACYSLCNAIIMTSNSIPKQNNLFAITFLWLVVLLFYYPIVFEGKIIGDQETIERYYPFHSKTSQINGAEYSNLQSDSVTHFYPWKETIHSLLKSGQSPYFDRFSLSGQPVMANPYSGLFYPFNYLTIFADHKTFYSIWFVIERLLFATLIYATARAFKHSQPGAIITSIVTSFSAVMASQFLPWDFNTVVWFGFVFFLLSKYLISSNIKWLIGLPLFLCLSFTAGHLEYVLFLSFAFFLFLLLYQYYNGLSKKRISIATFLFMLSILVGLLLAAISIAPYLGLSKISQRSESFSTALTASISPLSVFSFLTPGLSKLNYFYIGISSLPLFVYGCFNRQTTEQKATFSTLLILVCFGVLGPFLAPVINSVPVISGMRGLERISIAFPFFLGLMVGGAFDSIYYKSAAVSEKARKAVIIIMGLALAIALLRSVVQSVQYFNSGIFEFLIAQVVDLVKFFGYKGVTADKVLNLVGITRSDKFQLIWIGAIIIPLVVCVTSIYYFYRRHAVSHILKYLLLLLIPLELSLVGALKLKYMVKEDLFPETSSIAFLKSLVQVQVPHYRVASVLDDDCGSAMPFKFLEYYSIEQAGGYTSVYNRNYREFINAISHPDNLNNLLLGAEHSVGFGKNQDFALLKYAGVKYIITSPLCTLNSSDLLLVSKRPDLSIYELRSTLPRVYLAPNSIATTDKVATMRLMFDKNFNPRETVVIDGIDDQTQLIGRFTTGNQPTDASGLRTKNDRIDVEVTEYSNSRLAMTVDSKFEDATLVLLDNNIPGWRVTIDGHDVKIYSAFHSFMAVKVKRGRSSVVLSYVPPFLQTGMIVSMLSLVVYLIFGAYILTKFRRVTVS